MIKKVITLFSSVLIGSSLFFPAFVSAQEAFIIEKVEIEQPSYLDEDSRNFFPWFSNPAKNVKLKIVEKKTNKVIFEEQYPAETITPDTRIFSFLVYKVLVPGTEYSYITSGEEQAVTGKKAEYSNSFTTSGVAPTPSPVVTPTPTPTPSPSPTPTPSPSPTPTPSPILTPVPTPVPSPAPTPSPTSLFVIEKVTVEKRGYAEITFEDGRRILPFFSAPAINVKLKVTEKKTNKVIFDEQYPESKIQPDDTVFVFGFDDLSPLTEYSYTVTGEERTTGKKAEYSGTLTTNDFVSGTERDALKNDLTSSIETGRMLKEKAESLKQPDSVSGVDQWIDTAKKCFERVSDEGGKNREIINECKKTLRLLDEHKNDIELAYNLDIFLKSKKDFDAVGKILKDKSYHKVFKDFSLNINEIGLQINSRRSVLGKVEMLKNAGNMQEAQELFEEAGVSWDIKDLRSLFTGYKKIHDVFKKVSDSKVKQKLLEALQPIISETQEGSYSEAADALDVYMKEIKKYESALTRKSTKGDAKKRILDSFKKLGESLNL